MGAAAFLTLVAALLGGPSPAAAAPVPVSYTHLRAHETVLDIVCRLLLENKNHAIKSERYT